MKLLLYSGGIDSTCLALLERPELLVTIDYGQRSCDGEIRASKHIAAQLGLRHDVIECRMTELGAGDLAGMPSPEGAHVTETWPFRNQMLITLAAMKHARDGFFDIIIGTVSTDSDHPDGSSTFVSAISDTLQVQDYRMSVRAPAIGMTCKELVAKSGVSEEILRWTFSCYTGAVACGSCRGCLKNLQIVETLTAG